MAPARLKAARGREGGFTLLEVMVALAVFAFAAMALLNVAGANARTAAELERRALATMAADAAAVLVAATPAAAAQDMQLSGEEEFGGVQWAWRGRMLDTQDPAMTRIEIEVRERGAEQVLVTRTVLRRR